MCCHVGKEAYCSVVDMEKACDKNDSGVDEFLENEINVMSYCYCLLNIFIDKRVRYA